MILEQCFHASLALIESNHGGRAPLWDELVHDIVESGLVGSIEACFQEHWGVETGPQSTVCPSGRETHDPVSSAVWQGHQTMIWALDQHVEQFVKLSEIYLERGNIFAKCLSNQGHEHRAQTQFGLLFLFNIQFQSLIFKTNFQFNPIILTTSVKAKVEKSAWSVHKQAISKVQL